MNQEYKCKDGKKYSKDHTFQIMCPKCYQKKQDNDYSFEDNISSSLSYLQNDDLFE